jgi:hypothetical protein
MQYIEIFYFVLLESFETHKYAVFIMWVCMYVFAYKVYGTQTFRVDLKG